MKDLWDRASNALRDRVGSNNHTAWIAPLDLTGIDSGEAQIVTPTRFISDWVQRHYADAIRDALVEVGAPIARLTFSVAAPRRAAAATAPRKQADAAPAAPVRAAEPEMSAPLDARFTFDNFVVGKPNELAHAAARRVAEGGPVPEQK